MRYRQYSVSCWNTEKLSRHGIDSSLQCSMYAGAQQNGDVRLVDGPLEGLRSSWTKSGGQ